MFNKRQIAAVGLVLATAMGGFAGSTSTAEAARSTSTATAGTALGGIAITPSKGLKNLQRVKVKITRYGKYTGTAQVVQCTVKVLTDTTHPKKYCDTRRTSIGHLKVVKGVGTGYFKVRVGKSFKAGSASSKCVKGGKCLVLATSSGKVPKFASFSQVSFKR